MESAFLLVGVRGFEPPASWSRTKRSTKLSHTPLSKVYYKTLSAKKQVKGSIILGLKKLLRPLEKVRGKGYA